MGTGVGYKRLGSIMKWGLVILLLLAIFYSIRLTLSYVTLDRMESLRQLGDRIVYENLAWIGASSRRGGAAEIVADSLMAAQVHPEHKGDRYTQTANTLRIRLAEPFSPPIFLEVLFRNGRGNKYRVWMSRD